MTKTYKLNNVATTENQITGAQNRLFCVLLSISTYLSISTDFSDQVLGLSEHCWVFHYRLDQWPTQ